MKPLLISGLFSLAGAWPLAAALTVTGLGLVVPNPRTVPVLTVEVTLSEACKLSTFTVADVKLTRDSVSVPLTAALTVTSNSPTQYRLNGLGGFTGAEGFYQLTVNGTNIQDLAGTNGTGSAAVTWVTDYTIAIYENNAPVVFPTTAPVVDATAFVNRSIFSVSTSVLYDMQSVLFYTNTGSGVMTGIPGFRFDYVTNFNGLSNGVRLTASAFVNQGSISADTSLQVFATNIISSGELHASAGGIIRLNGNPGFPGVTNGSVVDVSRSAIRTGASPEFGFGLGSIFGNFYQNEEGVTDRYWGEGTNNSLRSGAAAMPLSFGNFNVPFTFSPSHMVLENAGTGTNTVSVPGFGFGFGIRSDFGAFVYTNQPTPSNRIVQVVFVPTNNIDTNFSTSVRFDTDFGITDAAVAIVEFQSVDFDIVFQRFTTNFIYFLDSSAQETNLTLLRNFFTNTRRPSNYDITRASPYSSDWQLFTVPTNAAFTPELIYNPATYRSNRVNVLYAGYSAQIGQASTNGGFGFGLPTPPIVIEPTNMAGRVEIVADTVNLDQTRVRTESLFSVRTRNLLSNQVALVDAPFLIYDIATREPEMIITNLAPPSVRRLSGQLSAWSGVWTNFETTVTPSPTNVLVFVTNTTEIRFHVLILDNVLQTIRPTVVHEFSAHADNLVIGDFLRIGKTLLLDATNLHITSGIQLPPGYNWAASNIQRVVNLTNDGSILIPQTGFFESVRSNCPPGSICPPQPYDNFVNNGFISAAGLFIRASNFVNQGSPLAANGGVIQANSGLFSLKATCASLSNSTFIGSGDVEIFAGKLTNRHGLLLAGSNSPGALILSVTNVLTDGGTDADNRWFSSAGFRFLTRPAAGDLLGTRLESRITRNSGDSYHYWPAGDFGATTNGFTNNLALGRLVLNGIGNNSLFRFFGTATSNALYVDYLDLQNSATNYDTALSIAPNLVIYFANASVPPAKLNGRHGGRLRWVSTYAGPNSFTNIFYASTMQTYTFNLPLAQATDFDSDGDNIANFDDPEPFFVADQIMLQTTNSMTELMLLWNGLANLHPPPFITNYVEINTNGLGMEAWQPFLSLTYAFPATNLAPVSVTISLVGPVPPVFEPVPLSVTNFLPVLPGNDATFRVRIDPLQPPLPDP